MKIQGDTILDDLTVLFGVFLFFALTIAVFVGHG